MSDPVLTFIGGGNMANSIIGGLVAQGYQPTSIRVCDPLEANLATLQEKFGVTTTSDNSVGVKDADAIILAVKPQVMKDVCLPLRATLTQQPLVISIAAGITVNNINTWLGEDLAVVRCMPNTPALVQKGASGLYASNKVSAAQKTLADKILQAVGIVEWLNEESLIDTVTALSGSGPAYFFLLMEAMIDSAVKQGLSPTAAQQLATQTCLGAGHLAQQSDVDVAELRRRVSSPGGTTLKALDSFEQDGFQTIVDRAMQAAAARAVEMAKEFS